MVTGEISIQDADTNKNIQTKGNVHGNMGVIEQSRAQDNQTRGNGQETMNDQLAESDYSTDTSDNDDEEVDNETTCIERHGAVSHLHNDNYGLLGHGSFYT